MTDPVPTSSGQAGTWLGREGESSAAGAQIRTHQWESSPLGPLDAWPEHLRLVVRVMLSSQFPMMVVWGPDTVQLYNDAFRPILGRDKHPSAMGGSARDTWAEIWSDIGPLFSSVLNDEESVRSTDQRLIIERNGYPEETFFTYSYSPIHGESGDVAGLLVVATETTTQVIDHRRLTCIGALATALVSTTSIESVAEATVGAIADCPDMPAVEIHLLVDDNVIRIATPLQPLTSIEDRESLRELGAAEKPVVLDRSWEPGYPARRAAFGIDDPNLQTVVVTQLNPNCPFDEGYEQFIQLVRRLLGASLTAALGRAAEVGELRHISDTLQHAMLELASDLPTVAARYLPAATNLSVGGDWYEVIDLGFGRRALIVGDCVGHGLEAATAMGALRNVSRAMLSDGRGPAQVIDSLHRFAKTTPAAFCATVVCAVVDLAQQVVTYSNAGHPPPLLVRDGHAVWLDQALASPLAVGSPERTEAQVSVHTDDLLVLYTDGLIERRGETLDDGLERLAKAAVQCVDESVQVIADHVIEQLVDDSPTDDVALVVKRVHPYPM